MERESKNVLKRPVSNGSMLPKNALERRKKDGKNRVSRRAPKAIESWYNEIPSPYERRRYRPHQRNERVNDGGFWCLMIGVLFVFLIIPLALIAPYPRYYAYSPHGPGPYRHPCTTGCPTVRHHPLQDESVRMSPEECTVGEEYSTELHMCIPRVRVPDGADRSLIDHGTLPCDNFYQHACGKWLDSHEDESRAFKAAFWQNQKVIRDIIEDSGSGPIYKFYMSCVDTLVHGKHKSDSLLQIKHELERSAGELFTHADLPRVFGRLARNGFDVPFTLTIENHPKEPRLIPMLRASGMFNLDDRDIEYMTNMFLVLADGDVTSDARRLARHKARAVLGIVKSLRAINPPEIQDYISYLQDPKQFEADLVPWADVVRIVDQTGETWWNRFLQNVDGHGLRFAPEEPTWVLGKSYFRMLDFHNHTIYQWRSYVEFSVIYNLHMFFPDLPSDVYFREHTSVSPYWDGKLHRRYDGHVIEKTKKGLLQHVSRHIDTHFTEDRTYNKREYVDSWNVTTGDCLYATHKLLPGLVAKEFLSRTEISEEDRTRVYNMVKSIREEYTRMIEETVWLDHRLKAQAKDKIKNIVIRVAHPNQWEAEPFAESIEEERYLRSLDMIREYRVQRTFDLWKDEGVYFNRDVIARFGAPLSIVNAWFSPTTNTITIPAGIMRYPFYHREYSNTSLYATLGAIVGHELGHALDPKGSLFDRDGSFSQWIGKSAREMQLSRMNCIATQYHAPDYCPEKGDYGAQTIGETSADLLGLEMAYRAYHRISSSTPLLQERQAFYISYAQMWCAINSVEKQCQRVSSDPHPLPSERVIQTLRQLPYFHEAYDCRRNQAMVRYPGCAVYGNRTITSK